MISPQHTTPEQVPSDPVPPGHASAERTSWHPLEQLGLPGTEPDGDPAVAAALAPLATAGDRPLAEQLDVYAGVHRALQTALDAETS